MINTHKCDSTVVKITQIISFVLKFRVGMLLKGATIIANKENRRSVKVSTKSYFTD